MRVELAQALESAIEQHVNPTTGYYHARSRDHLRDVIASAMGVEMEPARTLMEEADQLRESLAQAWSNDDEPSYKAAAGAAEWKERQAISHTLQIIDPVLYPE